MSVITVGNACKPPAGCLMVGIDPENREVVVNLDRDRNGVGHITFSPDQARNLARLLIEKAADIDLQPLAEVAKCPHCGETFKVEQLRDGLIPTHDFPKPCRSVCRGAGQNPRPLHYTGPLGKDAPSAQVSTADAGVYWIGECEEWVVATSEKEAADFMRSQLDRFDYEPDTDCSADLIEEESLEGMTFSGDFGTRSFLAEFQRGQAAGEPVPRHFASHNF